MRRLETPATITMVLLALSATAPQAASPCPGGRFVVRSRPELAVQPTILMLGDDGRVSALGACAAVTPQKAGRKWPLRAKLRGCEGAATKARLQGRWTDGCARLALMMRGKKLRRAFVATRSVCGDAFLDVARGEQCDSTSPCVPGERCDDCRCISRTATPTTPETGATTTTIPGLPADDADCLPGDLEDRVGLDRRSPDSDGDGIEDGADDLDGDGLSNCDEAARGTTLADPDSDDDGSSDLEEVAVGTDPLDPDSNLLVPGEIVDGAITTPNQARRYWFKLASARRVYIRASDVNGSDRFSPCVYTYDAAGALYGAPRCGENAAVVVRDYAAGVYTILVSDLGVDDAGAFQLQYQPLHVDTATRLPTGPDALVDVELPLGLLRLYRFTLDSARRVAVHLSTREFLQGFEPCFTVLTEAGAEVPDADVCDGTAARDLDLGAGTYFVLVSEKNYTPGGLVRLRVLPLHPDFARDLETGEHCRALDGRDDLDVYRIVLPVEAPVQLVLTKESGTQYFTPCLRLWNESTRNVFFGSQECSGPITVNPTLPAGTYYATVHDDFRTTEGSYCLGRQ